jgi:hypothetical protein
LAHPKGASLPQPTVDLVRAAEVDFNIENEAKENALTALVEQFPQNTDRSHILLKVAAINQLYSTNVYAVRIVADHIADLKIDAFLDSGSLEVVDWIARVRVGGGKERYFLSFASKYCIWHRPGIYPIYDSRAERALWEYKLQFGLGFSRKALWEYASFVNAVKEFQARFELQPLTFKQVDKLLFLRGDDLMERR